MSDPLSILPLWHTGLCWFQSHFGCAGARPNLFFIEPLSFNLLTTLLLCISSSRAHKYISVLFLSSLLFHCAIRSSLFFHSIWLHHKDGVCMLEMDMAIQVLLWCLVHVHQVLRCDVDAFLTVHWMAMYSHHSWSFVTIWLIFSNLQCCLPPPSSWCIADTATPPHVSGEGRHEMKLAQDTREAIPTMKVHFKNLTLLPTYHTCMCNLNKHYIVESTGYFEPVAGI